MSPPEVVDRTGGLARRAGRAPGASRQRTFDTERLRRFLDLARVCFGLDAGSPEHVEGMAPRGARARRRPPRLLELPGKALSESGERASLRLLEAVTCDPEALCARIEAGRYSKPFIIEDSQTRRLHFGLDLVQSAMRLDDPYALEFAYTRKMMAFLLFAPNPQAVLMVGLGGGSLAKFCHRHLPGARLTVIELDPDVIALSAEFQVPDDERLAIVQADAAAYLPKAEGDVDVLLLDGFDAKGIAPTFLSREFYQAARRRLRPGGVCVANFAESRKHWTRHQALLNEAFDGRVRWAVVPGGDNHIALAFADAGYRLDWAQLEERAAALAEQYPLDFQAILESLREGAELRWAQASFPS